VKIDVVAHTGIGADPHMIDADELYHRGLPIAMEQLWKPFHNCSYRIIIVMQSMLL
jgi:hypothetical protein